MANVTLKTKDNRTQTFIPKMANFEVSSRYEGLSLKKENTDKSLQELKLKYAR